MSGLLNAVSTAGAVIGMNYGANDESLQPVDYRVTPPFSFGIVPTFSDVLWPRSRRMGADYANIAPIWDSTPQMWEWNIYATGQRNRKRVTGITKDSNGNPLGGVTVYLFNTATGLLVDKQVSASDGSYTTFDPNAVACFEVGYLAGSPDTTGATLNTVTGV
jgi:hypothetical protein